MVLKLIILGAAVFYAAVLPRYDVGSFNDDAVYMLASKSLLQGRYVNLQKAGEPPLNDPLPGYPFFLAPFLKILGSHWNYLKLLSVVMTLLTSVLLWKLFQGWLSHWALLLSIILYAFNPATVYLSGAVMSEPCFLFLCVCLFLCLKLFFGKPYPWLPWLMGALAGWLALIRPQGFVLIPSIAIVLVYVRKYRPAAGFIACSLTIWGSVLLRNYFVTQTPAGYSKYWMATLPVIGTSYTHLIHNIKSVLDSLVLHALVALPGLPEWLNLALLLSFLGIMVYGLFSLVRETSHMNPTILSITVFCWFYMIIHVLWLAVHPRYFLPVLPFGILFFLRGTESLGEWIFKKKTSRLGIIAGTLLLLIYMYQGVYAVKETLERPQENKLPFKTFSWIKLNTEADSKILSYLSPNVCLYADRHGFALLPAETLDEFRYLLYKVKATYVLCSFVPPILVHSAGVTDANKSWAQIKTWLGDEEPPPGFKKVYENTEEGTALFRIEHDPAFIRAWQKTGQDGRIFKYNVSNYEKSK